MADFAPVLATLNELYLARVENGQLFLEQRIQGLQTYVVAIGLLTAFTISHQAKPGALIAYQLILTLATSVVLLFQCYWMYYADFEYNMAREYHGEISQFAQDKKWPLTDTKCVDKESKKLREGKKNRKDWLWRKSIEANNKWKQFSSSTKFEIGDEKSDYFNCNSKFDHWDIIFSSRQINIWTICIIGFYLIAFLAMRAILGSTNSANSKTSGRLDNADPSGS